MATLCPFAMVNPSSFRFDQPKAKRIETRSNPWPTKRAKPRPNPSMVRPAPCRFDSLSVCHRPCLDAQTRRQTPKAKDAQRQTDHLHGLSKDFACCQFKALTSLSPIEWGNGLVYTPDKRLANCPLPSGEPAHTIGED